MTTKGNSNKIYYGCPPANYVRCRFVKSQKDAEVLNQVLCGYARELAERSGSNQDAAYWLILQQFQSVLEPKAMAIPFGMLVQTKRVNVEFSSVENAVGFMLYVRRTFGNAWDTTDPTIRTDLFQQRYWCLLRLFKDHGSCEPRHTDATVPIPAEMVIRGLELWAEINCLVPPCKYLRLQRALADMNIMPDAARAVLQRHGADVLDDLVEGLRNGSLDESAMWGMSVLDELPHDPSFQRQPVPPILGENRIADAIEYAFPKWEAAEGFAVSREGLFEDNHEYRPGWYRPAEMPKNETDTPEEPSAGQEPVAAETNIETATGASAISGAPEKPDAFCENIRRVCASCGSDLRTSWEPIRAAIRAFPDGERLVSQIENAIARMFAHECVPVRDGGHRPDTSFDAVLGRIVFYEGSKRKLDETSIPVLGVLEECGIPFSDSREFEKLRRGLRQRLPDMNVFPLLLICKNLSLRLRDEVPNLADSQRSALTYADTFLNGIDLFSIGEGNVPLATCLRVALAAKRKNIGWEKVYYLWKIHLPGRTEELRARLENPKTGAHDILRMLQRH